MVVDVKVVEPVKIELLAVIVELALCGWVLAVDVALEKGVDDGDIIKDEVEINGVELGFRGIERGEEEAELEEVGALFVIGVVVDG